MGRFYRGYPWRWLITDLDGAAVTAFERVAMNASLLYKLNAPAEMRATAPSDDPRVNLNGPDNLPSLDFGDRMIFGFRREAPDVGDPWVCRFGGVITQIEDAAPAEQPYSSFTAYDPWQLLFSRPLWDGTSPVGADGLTYTATPGSTIASEIVNATINNDGDAHIGFSTFETTSNLNITFQQGTSVGSALQQLTQTGTMDIIFEPFYSTSQPTLCAAMTVYSAPAGSTQDGAVMSWDIGRSIQAPSILYDAAELANDVRFHLGQGGDAVTQQEDATSQGKYGLYVLERWFPKQTQELTVEAFAAFVLCIRKQGKRTATLTPSSLVAPIPLIDYGLGDRVPVYASERLRNAIPWANEVFCDGTSNTGAYQRVYGIPISISDDGVERVDRLLASPDGF